MNLRARILTMPLPFLLRAPDDGAGGGIEAAPATTTTAATTTTDAGDTGGIFDAVGNDGGHQQPAAGDGKPQRPEHIPEQFWDPEKGEPRIEQLAKSWSDLRTKVARGEGRVPDKPEGYTLPEVEGIPAGIIKADDPLWTEVRAAAHQAGVTEKQLQALVKPYLLAAAKAQPQPVDPEAAKAAHQAAVQEEVAKLGPNGRALVRDIGQWIAGMENRGALTAGEARALKAIGTAEGVRALAKLREATGAPAIPTEALATESMTLADAQRMMQEGYRTNDQAKIERARQALVALDRQGQLGPVRAA